MPSHPSHRLQRATALALQAVALLLLALHLYVYFALPPSTPNTVPDQTSVETAWWGLWPVHYLPLWAVLFGIALVLGAIAFTWRAPSRIERLALPLITAALFLAFYLFPLAHTRWGDAFMLSNGISYPDAALRLTHSWQAPLDVFLHAQVWQLLHPLLGWEDAMPAYRLLSPLGGLLYLLAALALSRDLARRQLAPAWLTYGLLATLGLLQLFFGYVENYSFAAALILIYLWLAARVLLARAPLWHAAAVLALAHATHPSTIILAPSLLYLGWHVWRHGVGVGESNSQRNQSAAAVVLQIALPMLLVGGATFAWMEASGHGLYALLNTDRPGGGDASWFVPLWATTTRWERYTLLSWPHLRDWLNQQLLVAPIVLPALVVVGTNLWLARRAAHKASTGVDTVQPDAGPSSGSARLGAAMPAALSERERTGGAVVSAQGSAGAGAATGATVPAGASGLVRFLLVAGGFYQLFIFVWNPDYGGQRDWDLFSLAAIPAALLLAVLLPRALPDGRFLRRGAVPLLILQGWHTAAWIYQNTRPWEWPD